MDGSSIGRKKTQLRLGHSVRNKWLPRGGEGVIQVSSLRNEGSKRVLLDGLGRISIARTLVSLIRKEVLPLSWVLGCGRGLMEPTLRPMTACKNSGFGSFIIHKPFFFFPREGAGGA